MTTRWVRPTRQSRAASVTPAFPFHGVQWPEGVTVALSASFGVGKSSSAALLGNPGSDGSPPMLKNWITTEQDPTPVQAMFKRLKVPCPQIWAADPLDPVGSVKRAIRTQVTGAGALTVLDSTTPLGIDGAVETMNFIVQDCLNTGRRAMMISQQNKQKEILGKIALAFIPDIVIEIDVDQFGRRRLRVSKNRHGPPSTTYFQFGEEGKILQPDFTTVAHSVEGAVMDMQLIPYGLHIRGGKWDGLLSALDTHRLLPDLPGVASAAIKTGATACGFLAPPDEPARKALAESHGLRWLDLEEGVDLLADARRRGRQPAAPPELDPHEDLAL